MTVRLFVRPGKKAIVASPSFSIYDITVKAQGGELVSVPLGADGCVDVDAILNAVSDYGADLLVIGAYGHSRVRELVLGGVTRHLLRHMTIPVLMSH